MSTMAGRATMGKDRAVAMGPLQEAYFGAGHEYERGSPHLRHAELRQQILARIRQLTAEQFSRTGRCRVLEIGAGHGGYTDHIAAMGADLTVTEMSLPSLEVLRGRFEWNPQVRLLYDEDGGAVFEDDSVYDLVLCISVLHHIPDYVTFIRRVTGRIEAGGAFGSFQDPLWYPRRGRMNMTLDRGAYYFWRLTQGNLLGGMQTRVRRARGTYDEANPADMAEYHVVRSGVDEHAIEAVLREKFASVEQWRYWSTQNPTLQSTGTRVGLETTFGFVARRRAEVS